VTLAQARQQAFKRTNRRGVAAIALQNFGFVTGDGVRWKTFSSATSPATFGTTWMAEAPEPMTPTRIAWPKIHRCSPKGTRYPACAPI